MYEYDHLCDCRNDHHFHHPAALGISTSSSYIFVANECLNAFLVESGSCDNIVGGGGGGPFSFQSNYAAAGWITRIRVYYTSNSING